MHGGMRRVWGGAILTVVLVMTGGAQVANSGLSYQKAEARVFMQAAQRRLLTRVSFADLPGWQSDDHQAAFDAFRLSCERILKVLKSRRRVSNKYRAFRSVCRAGMRAGRTLSPIHARRFFETHFVPYRVRPTRTERLLTGYYEPILRGSRVKTSQFRFPVYRVPDDLYFARSNRDIRRLRRAGIPAPLVAARRTRNGLRPYYTRAEIDQGALQGRGLELLYLADEIDLFFLHIQGSGRVVFPDGSTVRLAFAAKNGYPYTSIGKYMIRTGLLRKDQASLEQMKAWLRKAGPERVRKILWQNKSYIFFREMKDDDGPFGAQMVKLTPVRSLAVDKRYHYLGLPIFVNVPGLKDDQQKPFRRLMIAQDVGSAIKGPERGDIFWGSGDIAGQRAGLTGHRGQFYVLLPKF